MPFDFAIFNGNQKIVLMVISFGEVLMDCLPDKNVIGGAPFNVVTHLRRLGEEASMISKIGKDELGDEIFDFMQKENIAQYIQRDGNFKTGYVTVTLNNGQPSYTIHRDCGWEHLDYKSGTPEPQYLVFGSLALHFPANKKAFEGYLKDFENTTKVCDINLRAPFYDQETILFCLKNTDILKINDEELDYLKEEFKLKDVFQWLKDQFGIDRIILTKGAEGSDLLWEGKQFGAEAGRVKDLKDTVGAGDAFTSMFIYGLLKGVSPVKNLQRAANFAAMICERNGAIPSDLEMYDRFRL